MARKGPSKPKVRKPHILLAWIHPGMVHSCFMESVLQLVHDHTTFDLGLLQAQSGPLISKARNLLAETFLQNDIYTHLLFADSDMAFKPEHVQMLLDADKPIVGALYYGIEHRDGSTFPVALDEGPDGVMRPVKSVDPGLTQVGAIGMGLTLIKRQVLQDVGVNHKLLTPFAETVVDGKARGEDVTFCLLAAQKGHTTWVCGDARAGHAKTFVIDG